MLKCDAVCEGCKELDAGILQYIYKPLIYLYWNQLYLSQSCETIPLRSKYHIFIIKASVAILEPVGFNKICV